MKTIGLLFLICATLMIASGFLRTKDRVLSFDSGFAAPGHLSPSSSIDDKNTTSTANDKFIQRCFKWRDPSNITRETCFSFLENALKKEIKSFGVARNMGNSFFIEKRGFKVIDRQCVFQDNEFRDKVVSIVDYQGIFRRNLKYFPTLTRALSTSAEIPPTHDPLHSFLCFIQHIPYNLPPQYYQKRFINSFFIPLVLLYEQYGDCDSKSLLLAEFLCTTEAALKLNSPGERLASVLVRGNGLSHVLLAVKRTPLPGMSYLYDLKKGTFILLETTRPGWSPGFVSKQIQDAIKAGLYSVVELN